MNGLAGYERISKFNYIFAFIFLIMTPMFINNIPAYYKILFSWFIFYISYSAHSLKCWDVINLTL